MGSKILLTGAGGLVGRAVARKLSRSGRSFVAIDQVNSVIDGHKILGCDVQDTHGLHALAARYQFDGVIHCAGYSGPMMGQNNPAAVIATNVGGTTNLLELARIHSIPRFVFCSSVSAVGPTAEPTLEHVPLRPSSVYGATKAASEALLAAYKHRFDIEAVSLRLSAVWGPERTTVCALGSMIKNAVARRDTVRDSGGDFPTQYLHVEDAADAIVRALETQRLQQDVYNINGGECVSFREVVDRVRAVLPEAKINIGPGGDVLYDRQEEFLMGAARRDLGFQPRMSLEKGIREFVESVSANGTSRIDNSKYNDVVHKVLQ